MAKWFSRYTPLVWVFSGPARIFMADLRHALMSDGFAQGAKNPSWPLWTLRPLRAIQRTA